MVLNQLLNLPSLIFEREFNFQEILKTMFDFALPDPKSLFVLNILVKINSRKWQQPTLLLLRLIEKNESVVRTEICKWFLAINPFLIDVLAMSYCLADCLLQCLQIVSVQWRSGTNHTRIDYTQTQEARRSLKVVCKSPMLHPCLATLLLNSSHERTFYFHPDSTLNFLH